MRKPPTLAATTRQTAWGRRLLVLERALFGVGLLLLGLYGVACAELNTTQRLMGRSFDRTLALQLASEQHDTSEWAAGRIERFQAARHAPVEPLARLEIPDAGVSVMVLDGTGSWVLDRAVGRIEGTAGLGATGNLGIAGHRDGFFRGLRHLEIGDSLTLTSLEGTATYAVDSLRVVKPAAVEVLDPTPHKSLTLVTCYPFYFVGDAPDRFIVHAREVHFEAWSDAPLPPVAAR